MPTVHQRYRQKVDLRFVSRPSEVTIAIPRFALSASRGKRNVTMFRILKIAEIPTFAPTGKTNQCALQYIDIHAVPRTKIIV